MTRKGHRRIHDSSRRPLDAIQFMRGPWLLQCVVNVNAPLFCHSCTPALLWCSLSFVSSPASCLTTTLWTGTLFTCMVCVRGRTVRSPSPCPRLAGLGVTLCITYTLIELRWHCVQHHLFSCKASPRGCPDPTDLWASGPVGPPAACGAGSRATAPGAPCGLL
jgi:hypothetical protein